MNDLLNSLASESILEDAALAWLASLGFTIKHDLEIAPRDPLSA
jgi:hypothetical protein